jgi:uncharacterized protein (TIGR02145 family)
MKNNCNSFVYTLILSGSILLLNRGCIKKEASTVPVLTTTSVTDLATTSAKCGGTITSDGNAPIIAYGVCWNETTNPQVTDSKTVDGNGSGHYVSTLGNLSVATTYYVRAYATNSVGTGYGNVLLFSTLGEPPAGSTQEATNISVSGATLNGIVNAQFLSTEVTFEYGSDKNYGQTVTAVPSPVNGNTNINTAAFISGLTSGSTYHFRIKMSNLLGTTYGNDYTFKTVSIANGVPLLNTFPITDISTTGAYCGGSITDDNAGLITERGVCWGTSPGPLITGFHTSDGIGPGGFTSMLTGLTANTKYYVRAYATNSVGTGYGNEIIFNTDPIILPTLTTRSISSISFTSAISGGDISDDGGGMINARGVCWAKSPNPVIDNLFTLDGIGNYTYSSMISGLDHGATYYVRAYATNESGTGYGNQLAFITPDITDITDVDGNNYRINVIGTQVWMLANLKTTRYNDGTDIPNITLDSVWSSLDTPAYCWYNNDIDNKYDFGAIYNGFAVLTGNLCPVGWHVSTTDDWTILNDFLKNNSFGYEGSGDALAKSIASTYQWTESGHYAAVGNHPEINNNSSFNAHSVGLRDYKGSFINDLGTGAVWWSPDNSISPHPLWDYAIFSGESNILKGSDYPQSGFSVRCVKD